MGKAAKLQDGAPKYKDPLTEVQDQIAARIITYYLADVERIEAVISEYFGAIESRRVEPESSSEFGYEGHHFILLTPEEAFASAGSTQRTARFRTADQNRFPARVECCRARSDLQVTCRADTRAIPTRGVHCSSGLGRRPDL